MKLPPKSFDLLLELRLKTQVLIDLELLNALDLETLGSYLLFLTDVKAELHRVWRTQNRNEP